MRNGFSAPCVNVVSILTCRRSASPRATGLGTGTEGAAGAHPFPVRPWSSSSESRDREINHRKPHLHTEVAPPNPTLFLFLLLFKMCTNNEFIDTPHGIVFELPHKQKKTKLLLCLLAPVTTQLYFSCHRGNRSRMFIRRCVGGRLHFHSDSWRATGSLSTSSLPAWAPHGCTGSKCGSSRWGLLFCRDHFSFQGWHKSDNYKNNTHEINRFTRKIRILWYQH